MSGQSVALPLNSGTVSTTTWRSRVLSIILLLAIGGVFWISSRYPALMKRYSAGTHVTAKGALTFGTVYPVDRSMPLATRVWRTTVNWLDANRVGMTFSFLFGPAALAFLASLPRRRTRSRWLNTVYGAVGGLPLGVCSNCIAPIARGLFASGMSTESVLATMFASPALNVVVLAMTFVLFPMSVALLKLSTVLFLIFVFTPAISARQKNLPSLGNSIIDLPISETWSQAAAGLARTYLRSFWYVFRIAFPFMIGAAVLGAFAIELLPPNALIMPV
ncbi:MAG TPA: permease, partial [Terriglobales bacterium]|nr:permease [Terriglobales bacterium]